MVSLYSWPSISVSLHIPFTHLHIPFTHDKLNKFPYKSQHTKISIIAVKYISIPQETRAQSATPFVCGEHYVRLVRELGQVCTHVAKWRHVFALIRNVGLRVWSHSVLISRAWGPNACELGIDIAMLFKFLNRRRLLLVYFIFLLIIWNNLGEVPISLMKPGILERRSWVNWIPMNIYSP